MKNILIPLLGNSRCASVFDASRQQAEVAGSLGHDSRVNNGQVLDGRFERPNAAKLRNGIRVLIAQGIFSAAQCTRLESSKRLG